MKIDWNEAPEWAVAHALYTFVNQITPVWVGVDQWQDVVRGKPFPYGGGVGEARHNPMRAQFQYETPRPAPWTGEGLPPVGTVCEFAGGTPCPEDPFDKDLKEGMKVTIIAHFKCGDFTLAAFTFNPENPDRGMVQVEQGNFGCFRPIRTPEQIAAEEREAALTDIALLMGKDPDRPRIREMAAILYDAGYRKQVKP